MMMRRSRAHNLFVLGFAAEADPRRTLSKRRRFGRPPRRWEALSVAASGEDRFNLNHLDLFCGEKEHVSGTPATFSGFRYRMCRLSATRPSTVRECRHFVLASAWNLVVSAWTRGGGLDVAPPGRICIQARFQMDEQCFYRGLRIDRSEIRSPSYLPTGAESSRSSPHNVGNDTFRTHTSRSQSPVTRVARGAKTNGVNAPAATRSHIGCTGGQPSRQTSCRRGLPHRFSHFMQLWQPYETSSKYCIGPGRAAGVGLSASDPALRACDMNLRCSSRAARCHPLSL